MHGNCSWCTLWINTWSPFVQHFLASLFFIVNRIDIASYVDDNKPYATASDIDSLITSLE